LRYSQRKARKSETQRQTARWLLSGTASVPASEIAYAIAVREEISLVDQVLPFAVRRILERKNDSDNRDSDTLHGRIGDERRPSYARDEIRGCCRYCNSGSSY
jgi:hypothetical protein